MQNGFNGLSSCTKNYRKLQNIQKIMQSYMYYCNYLPDVAFFSELGLVLDTCVGKQEIIICGKQMCNTVELVIC